MDPASVLMDGSYNFQILLAFYSGKQTAQCHGKPGETEAIPIYQK